MFTSLGSRAGRKRLLYSAQSFVKNGIPYIDSIFSHGVVSPGTSGQVLTSNGPNSPPSMQTPAGGGSWVSIATSSTSGTPSTISFTGIPQTYSELLLVGTVSQSGTGTTRFAISVDNGNNYSAAQAYGAASIAANNMPTSIHFINYTNNVGHIVTAHDSSSVSSPGLSGTANTPVYTAIHTGGMDAFQLSCSTGNFDAWSLTLYGK